jgi:hypothetical protein
MLTNVVSSVLQVSGRNPRRCLPRIALSLALLLTVSAGAQDRPTAKGQAPDNHSLLKRTLSGGYFVAKPFKEEYDRAVNRLRLLKTDIDSGRTTGAEALRELAELQLTLDGLRQQIEARKVFVPIAQTHSDTETVTFELGPERCLVITSDDVRVVGWDQPHVKCEIEKTVLSADGQRDDAELAAIKLVHRHGRDKSKVGRPPSESAADEEQFLASKDGQALSPEALENRRKLVAEIAASWAPFRDFQGKDIDLLDIEGLTHEQGNRQIQLEVSYAEGRTVGSEWRRYAKLTVYVPKSNSVAIRNGGPHNLTRVDVQKLKASLLLWSSGTHKSADSDIFQVRGLEGPLTVRQMPLDLIENVTGNVNITSTIDLSGRTTRHDNATGLMTMRHEPPLACTCKNIDGDFAAWFGRTGLQLEKIRGRIDVKNEFGDTKLRVDEVPTPVAHRILSEAGRIEVSLSRQAWGDTQLWALTQSGEIRSNARQDFLQDFNISTADENNVWRTWSGFRRARDRMAPFDPGDFQGVMSRPRLAMQGTDRPAGFDLISRGGTVVVEVNP